MKIIQIDNLTFMPVVLAPMAGITDIPFRKLVKNYGAGFTVSEMIASRAVIAQTKDSLQKSVIPSFEDIPVVQISGYDPYVTAEAARIVEGLGAKIIDLNFGCPVKKVVGGNSGAALMKDEKLARSIMKCVVDSVRVPVTVKMRLGWDENNKNGETIAKIAQDVGIKMLTVHGRTRKQMYSGQADWAAIRRVKEQVQIPVLANGDIKSIDDAKRCLDISGADGLMIGRAACSQPWLIGNIIFEYTRTRIREGGGCKFEMILAHYNDIIEHYGEERGVKLARKYVGWYTTGMLNSAKFRMQFNFLTSKKAAIESMYAYFASSPEAVPASKICS